jgi:hypothetical protein
MTGIQLLGVISSFPTLNNIVDFLPHFPGFEKIIKGGL